MEALILTFSPRRRDRSLSLDYRDTHEASSPFSPAGRDARASGSEGNGVVCERIEVRAVFNSLPRQCVARDRYDVRIVGRR